MQVVVDSQLVQYAAQGKGELVLILHGWGDSSLGWRDLTAELAKKYQVIAVDLPGFGGSEAPKEAWDLSNYARFVQHFLQKIGKFIYPTRLQTKNIVAEPDMVKGKFILEDF